MNDSIRMDPVSKDYEADGRGGLKRDRGLLTPAYFRLKIKRKGWMYAPNDQYGSDYHLIKRNNTAGDNTRLQTVGEKALRPLVDEGRAEDATVTLSQQARHGAGLEISIIDNQGEEESISYLPIGR